MLTAEQVQNWKDFSLRMARSCYATNEEIPLDWIVSEIVAIFEEIGEDANLYISWDNSHPYPEDHKYHGEIRGIKNGPMYLGDLISEMTEDSIYNNIHNYATQEEGQKLYEFWDNWNKDMEKYDELRNEIVDRWSSPVHCCIRAGIDQVGEQSAGVTGFTIEHLLKMYPEGIPTWLQNNFTKDLSSLPKETEILL